MRHCWNCQHRNRDAEHFPCRLCVILPWWATALFWRKLKREGAAEAAPFAHRRR